MKAQGKLFVYAMPERTHDATVLIAFKTKTDRAAAKKLLPGFREEEKNVLQYDFFKADVANVAAALDRFIVGDSKSAELLPSQPLVFQGPVFDLDFAEALRKEPSSDRVGMTNRERFADEYRKALVKDIQKHPDEYLYEVDKVPEIVAKFVPLFATNGANIGTASKAAARACGIRPTLSAIKAFLNS